MYPVHINFVFIRMTTERISLTFKHVLDKQKYEIVSSAYGFFLKSEMYA